ncbi:MAG: S1C family serine protease, partial [Tepidisphaeraceae bacterium]
LQCLLVAQPGIAPKDRIDVEREARHASQSLWFATSTATVGILLCQLFSGIETRGFRTGGRFIMFRMSGCAILCVLLCAQLVFSQEQRRPPGPNPNAGYLGARFGPVDEDAAKELGLDSEEGLLIMEVFKESPAEGGGLVINDVLIAFDGDKVEDAEAFVMKMRETKPGQVVKLTVHRNKEEKEISITLGKRPANFPPTQPTQRKEPTTKPG